MFDHLGLEWQYEPEGFEVTHRLSMISDQRFRYLPDFWIASDDAYGGGFWVEVKGNLDSDDDVVRLVDAAAHLSSAGGGGCGYDNKGAADVIVLGDIPRPLTGGFLDHAQVVLHMHKGDLTLGTWTWSMRSACRDGVSIARDVGSVPGIFRDCGYTADEVGQLLTRGVRTPRRRDARLIRAYEAGRSARFEFGESGVRR